MTVLVGAFAPHVLAKLATGTTARTTAAAALTAKLLTMPPGVAAVTSAHAAAWARKYRQIGVGKEQLIFSCAGQCG